MVDASNIDAGIVDAIYWNVQLLVLVELDECAEYFESPLVMGQPVADNNKNI